MKLSRTERVWLARIVRGARVIRHDKHRHHTDPTQRLVGRGLATKRIIVIDAKPGVFRHVLAITPAGVLAHGAP